MTKQRLLIIITILIIICAGAAVLLFLNKPLDQIGGITENQPVINLPVSDLGDGEAPSSTGGLLKPQTDGKLRVQLVMNNQASAYWIDESDRTFYYADGNGVINMVPYEGTAEVVYEGDGKPFVSLESSANGDFALMATGSASEPTFALINVITKKRTFLPITTQSATWHPNGKDLVYLRRQDGKNPAGLYLFAVAKSTSALLSPLNLLNVELSRGPKNYLQIAQRPTLAAPVSIWMYNLTNKTLKPLAKAGPGMMSAWNPVTVWDNVSFLPEEGGGRFSQAGVFESFGKPMLPSKCAFFGIRQFCAVPNETDEDLPESYLQKKIFTVDSLVLTSAAKTINHKVLWNSAREGQALDATALQVVGDALYFINRYDNKVYSLAPIK